MIIIINIINTAPWNRDFMGENVKNYSSKRYAYS